MPEVTITAEWTPDQHREEYFRLFFALLEAQKYICLVVCSKLGDNHSLACMYADKALIDADAVLDGWEVT
jgi:hypothetical protein